MSQLVGELGTMPDAAQWLIVALVALQVIVATGYVGLAVVLVTRTVVSLGRRAAAWLPAGGSQSGEHDRADVIVTKLPNSVGV